MKSQEYGDEKLQLVGNMIDLVSIINCYRVDIIPSQESSDDNDEDDNEDEVARNITSV